MLLFLYVYKCSVDDGNVNKLRFDISDIFRDVPKASSTSGECLVKTRKVHVNKPAVTIQAATLKIGDPIKISLGPVGDTQPKRPKICEPPPSFAVTQTQYKSQSSVTSLFQKIKM